MIHHTHLHLQPNYRCWVLNSLGPYSFPFALSPFWAFKNGGSVGICRAFSLAGLLIMLVDGLELGIGNIGRWQDCCSAAIFHTRSSFARSFTIVVMVCVLTIDWSGINVDILWYSLVLTSSKHAESEHGPIDGWSLLKILSKFCVLLYITLSCLYHEPKPLVWEK